MKRLIAAAALSSVAFSAFALETGKPFEQLDLDRALPNIEFAPVAASQKAQFAEAAGAGSTRSDASSGGEVPAESPWANDYNFIAPAL
jgi:hypothetical protein